MWQVLAMARLPSVERALWGEGLIGPTSPSPPWHTVGAQPYKMLLWRLSTLRLGSCEAAVLNPTLQWKKPVQGGNVVHPVTQLGKDSLALCPIAEPQGNEEGLDSLILAEESPSHQPRAKARLHLSRPGRPASAGGKR